MEKLLRTIVQRNRNPRHCMYPAYCGYHRQDKVKGTINTSGEILSRSSRSQINCATTTCHIIGPTAATATASTSTIDNNSVNFQELPVFPSSRQYRPSYHQIDIHKLESTHRFHKAFILNQCYQFFQSSLLRKIITLNNIFKSNFHFQKFHSISRRSGKLIGALEETRGNLRMKSSDSDSTSSDTASGGRNAQQNVNTAGHGRCGVGGNIGGSSLPLPACEVAMMNDAKNIFKSAINSVLPKEMVVTHLIVDTTGDVMTIKGGKTYRLNHNVYVVGFGKAVLGMARAVDDLIGQHIVRGVVSVPQGTQEDFRNAGKTDMLLEPASSIQVREGAANNMPDAEAHEAALEITDLVRSVGDGDLLLVLISGGGSALLPAPAPPITLSDMLLVTGQMSKGGATIGQLNTVRKQLDFLKGGGLAAMASCAQVISLILSDIVGDPIDLIASAPTVLDNSTPQDCLSIFAQLNIAHTIPKTVTEFLKEKSEKQGKPRYNADELNHVENLIIGSNKIACERACVVSRTLGYYPYVLSTELEGEAREVGKMFARLAAFIAGHLKNLDDTSTSFRTCFDDIRQSLILQHKLSGSQLDGIVSHVEKSKMASQGVCIVAGGETTVNVTGTGKGGRNQEMVTSVGLELAKVFEEIYSHSYIAGTYDENSQIVMEDKWLKSQTKTPQIVFLSAGTDGQDGPTPVAGGVVGLSFVDSANRADLNPIRYLDNNDCFSLLDKWAGGLGLVHTGLTGTNVMDIQLLMIKPA